MGKGALKCIHARFYPGKLRVHGGDGEVNAAGEPDAPGQQEGERGLLSLSQGGFEQFGVHRRKAFQITQATKAQNSTGTARTVTPLAMESGRKRVGNRSKAAKGPVS